jgi:serine/threonine protein kinase
MAGTPQYMTPEQARGEPVDARSDLFSLGSVLYAAATGRPPFRAETSYGVLKRITDTEPRAIRELAPETPEWLCRIIAKLHAKPVEDRFQSAAEVADVLEDSLAHAQNPTNPLPAWLVKNDPATRVWPRWSAAAAIFLAILAGVLAATGLPTYAPRGLSEHEGPPNVSMGVAGHVSEATWTDPSATMWEDGTAGAIEMVRKNVQDLDARSQKLWDTTLESSNSN